MNPISSGAEAAQNSLAARALPATILGALLLAAFWPILTGMVGSWFDEPANMEHGILIIPIAGYMVWRKRARLAQVPVAGAPWGVGLVLWGAAQAIWGVAAHWVWISRTAFLISLTGCIIALCGLQMLRELAYPLCTLVLMIAPPSFLYDRLTLNLQLLAAGLGAHGLGAVGYTVLREGNVLEMVGMKLSVEDACSGLRSLVSILFLCMVYNYFFVRGNVVRALILAMAVPIAVIANAVRIVITGIASQNDPKLAGGVPHQVLGYLTMVVAAIACVGLHILIVQVQKAWRSHQA